MSFRSTLPRDDSGAWVQVLRLLAGAAQTVAIGAGSSRNATGFTSTSRVIEVYATVDCYIRQGDGTVTATTSDSFLPSSHGRLYSLGGDKQAQATHLAVIRATSDGTLYISELE